MSEEATTAAELTLELSASYAHRVGEDLHVVLRLAEAAGIGPEPVPGEPAELELRAGKVVVRVPVTCVGELIDARVPADRLRPGLWRLALVAKDGEVRDVQGRLLNGRKQPVALLPGPAPTTQMPPPQPTPRSSSPVRDRAYRTAAVVANKGLGLLPEERASQARAALKKVGHRVLG
jgi:hypothetical protein